MKKIRQLSRQGIFSCLLAAGLSASAQPVYTNLHEFTGATTDGGLPGGLASGGAMLFGATAQGGTNGSGILYSIGTNGGNFNVLHYFTGEPDGAFPNEPLVSGATLFSTTYQGGITNNYGSVYKIGTNGAGYTVLRQFTNSPDAQQPIAGLALGGETLYGVSLVGGTNNNGSVFKMDTNGANFAILHHFTNTLDGSQPRGRLLLIGATLYGTTASGGSNGLGTVFKLNTNGSGYSVIYHFPGSPGASTPWAGLISDGSTLYGDTTGGGTSGAGTVFALGTNGGFTLLHSLTNGEGLSPQGPLLLNSNTLYGTALVQGTASGGILFQLQTNGAGFLVLKNFKSSTTGANPKGQVVLSGKNIFGICSGGSPGGSGSLYSLQLTPAITLPPQSLSVTNGAAVSFIGDGDGVGGLSYQWNSNAIPIAGATTTNLIYASVTTNHAGSYTLVVSNLYGSVTSSPAILTVSVNPLPSITAQPQNLTITNGNPATFSVTAINGPLGYRWYFNTNTLLVGQTTNSLTLASATTNNAGTYTVVMTNSAGAVTSSPAVLTVIVLPPPVITAQPQNLTVTNGNNATFTVTATNGLLTYQWYFNTNNVLAGQTNNFLTLVGTTTNNAGAYTVVVANGIGSVTSSPAVLTVTVLSLSPPVITSQPQNLTVTNGNTATLTITATNGTLNYQWYFNTNNLLAGQTSNSLTLASTTNNNAGTYTVVVANSSGAVTSSPAVLTVIVLPPPVITAQPQNLNVTNGNNATFSVTATNGPLTYQWYFNANNTNSPLAGKTNSTLTLTSAKTNNIGSYSVVVTNSSGSVTSSPANLTVYYNTSPIIVYPPSGQTVSYGSPVTFSVTAVGQAQLLYQWCSNSTASTIINNTTKRNGSTNASLTFTPLFTNSAYFYVNVLNDNGDRTSSPALLIVISAPLIVSNPVPATVALGSATNFNVSLMGAGPLRYQWYFNTNTVLTNLLGNAVAAETNGTINFASVSSSQLGRYSVIVTNSFGSATSSPALLDATAPGGLPPVITLQPLSRNITNGDPVTFLAAAFATNAMGYQWLFNTSTTITGATATNLVIPTANQPGTYALLVTNNFGAVTSTPAVLTVVGKPLMLSNGFDRASGSYAFTYANLAGSTNRLWASTNLSSTNFWKAIATNFMAMAFQKFVELKFVDAHKRFVLPARLT